MSNEEIYPRVPVDVGQLPRSGDDYAEEPRDCRRQQKSRRVRTCGGH